MGRLLVFEERDTHGACQRVGDFHAVVGGFLKRWRADPHRSHGDHGWLQQNWGGFAAMHSGVICRGWPLCYMAARLTESRPAPRFSRLGGLVRVCGQPDRLWPALSANAHAARHDPAAVFCAVFANGGFPGTEPLGEHDLSGQLLALGLPAVLLLTGGEALLNWVTAGKYGQAAYLVAGMIFVLGLESLRSQMELMVQAVERNEIFL